MRVLLHHLTDDLTGNIKRFMPSRLSFSAVFAIIILLVRFILEGGSMKTVRQSLNASPSTGNFRTRQAAHATE
jgi:hypothetical protein